MDYIDRMKKERSKLIDNVNKLRKFRTFGNSDFMNTTVAEKCLMDTQIEIMQSYIEVLTNRIILAKEREDNKVTTENKEEEFSKAIDKIMDDFMKAIDKFLEEGEE